MPRWTPRMRMLLLDVAVGGGAVVALQRLTFPYNGGYAYETSPSGTKVGTLRGTSGGSTLSIQSITDATGSAAASTLFALSGTDLNCGSTAIVYGASSLWYSVTIRETLGALTLDSVVTVFTFSVPAAITFTDSFADTDGTALRSHGTAWTATGPSEADVTNQNVIAITGNGVIYTAAGGNLYSAVHDVGAGSSIATATWDIGVAGAGNFATGQTTPGVFVSYTSNTGGYIRVRMNDPRQLVMTVKRSDNTTSSVTYDPGASPNSLKGGDTIGVVIAGGVATLYLKRYGTGTVVGSMPSITLLSGAVTVPSTSKVAFQSANGGSQKVSNLSVTTNIAFSLSDQSVPVYYADPTGFGYIPIKGTYSTTPTQLQWRLIKASDSSVVSGYDWANLTAIVSNNAYRGFAVAPVGSVAYKVQVRDSAVPGTVLTGTSFYIGDVVVGYGQSNMAGLFSSTYSTAADTTSGRAYLKLSSAAAFVNIPATTGQLAAAGFTNALIATTNRGAVLASAAVPGAALSDLTTGTAYFLELQKLIASLGGRISNFLIDQGEADAATSTTATWAAGWKTIYDAVTVHCSQIGTEIPAFMAITEGRTDSIAGTTIASSHLLLRSAQMNWATLAPQFAISHHKFDMDYGTGEYIHQSPQARYEKHAPRFAAAILKYRGLATNDLRGPYITGMTRSGNQLTLTGSLNGAVSIAADVGTILGFQVVPAAAYDGSQSPVSFFTNTATIISATVTSVTYGSGAFAIVLTLGSTPVAPVAMRYPASISTNGGTTVFDGSQPFGQSYGVTGQTAPPQIRGTCADGSKVGVFGLPDGLAA